MVVVADSIFCNSAALTESLLLILSLIFLAASCASRIAFSISVFAFSTAPDLVVILRNCMDTLYSPPAATAKE